MHGGTGVAVRVATFLGLLLPISAIFYSLIIYCGHLDGGRFLFVLGLMWSPGVAAVLTLAIHRRPLASIGWGWGRTRYHVLGYVIPLGYAGVAYLFAWMTGLAHLGNPESLAAIARDYGWTSWPASGVATG